MPQEIKPYPKSCRSRHHRPHCENDLHPNLPLRVLINGLITPHKPLRRRILQLRCESLHESPRDHRPVECLHGQLHKTLTHADEVLLRLLVDPFADGMAEDVVIDFVKRGCRIRTGQEICHVIEETYPVVVEVIKAVLDDGAFAEVGVVEPWVRRRSVCGALSGRRQGIRMRCPVDAVVSLLLLR